MRVSANLFGAEAGAASPQEIPAFAGMEEGEDHQLQLRRQIRRNSEADSFYIFGDAFGGCNSD